MTDATLTAEGPAASTARSGSAPPRPRWWQTSAGRSRLFQVLALGPAVVYLLAFFGYPVVRNLVMGFQHYTTKTYYTGEAPWVGLDNYAAVLGSSVFTQALLNTLLFTAGSLLGQFVIGLAIAVFFRRRFPLSGLFRSLLLLPWLIPLIVSGAVWRWILDQDHGALNQFLAALHLTEGHPGWLSTTSSPWSPSSASTSGSASPSTRRSCTAGSRTSPRSCTKRRPSTEPPVGAPSAM